MARKIAMELPLVDDLFSVQQDRDEASLEKVKNLPVGAIDAFFSHPFHVRQDADMDALIESVKEYGVMVPVLVRPKPGGRYELIAGHRRRYAAVDAGLNTLPCIIRELSDDEATILMVDSNLQREKILPSEKAYAYKMKLDAMKRQAGRPNKINLTPVVSDKPNGLRTNEELGQVVGESREQIRRYIRLTYLIKELLALVDKDKLKLRPAVELSYLTIDEQHLVFDLMQTKKWTPTLAQSQWLKKASQDSGVTYPNIIELLDGQPPKNNKRKHVEIPIQKVQAYLPAEADNQQIERLIVDALAYYMEHHK